MIPAIQLRQGNLVYPNKENNSPRAVKEVLRHSVQFETDRPVSEEDLVPIEIAPDILVDYGFKKLTEVTFSININLGIDLLVEFDALFRGEVVVGVIFAKEQYLYITKPDQTKYFHQLQNLYFALTGTELLIFQ